MITLGGLTISGESIAYYPENRMDAVETYMANGPMAGRARWSLAGEDVGDFMLDRRRDTQVQEFSQLRDAQGRRHGQHLQGHRQGKRRYLHGHPRRDRHGHRRGRTWDAVREFQTQLHGERRRRRGNLHAQRPMADNATWSLEGADKGYFTITGGMLKFRNSPNFEMPRGQALSATNTNIYEVTVKAEAGGEMDGILVTVTVSNVDELGTLSGDSSHSYEEGGEAPWVPTWSTARWRAVQSGRLTARQRLLHDHRRYAQVQDTLPTSRCRGARR